MKKQILITIESPKVITNPPQGETMQINIEGLDPLEVVLILSSVVAQMGSKELPPVIEAIKQAKSKIPPLSSVTGNA